MKKTLALILVVASLASSQNANLGTVGAKFLQIGVGSRAVALGGAYVAVANDASALFWNPAGIASVGNQSMHFTHVAWWSTIRLNAAAYALRLGTQGALGASVTVLSMDPMPVTTELTPEGTGETFTSTDLMIGLSYARALTDKFNVGLTVKYVQENIWNESASGVAFDVGTQYTLWFNDFTIGMSLTNFGGDLKMDGRDLEFKYNRDPTAIPKERLAPAKLEPSDYPLPLHFQVGAAMNLYKSENFGWKIAADVTHPNDNYERVNVGTEVGVFERLFLRAGYRYNYDDEDLTLGIGVALPIGDSKALFDYAYSRYNLLPSIHRFSVGFDF